MRYYSSTASEASLVAGIDGSATAMTVSGATGYPASTPFTAVLDPDTSSEEIVTVTVVGGANWTITRAQDGTVAVPHSTGARIRHKMTARDLREPQEHIEATTGVHGVGSSEGNVVGTSKAQTLTNKTISGSANTLTNISQSSVTGLASLQSAFNNHENDSGNVHGVGSGEGAVVGTAKTQTLTAKTMSGASNTFSNIPQSAVTGLTTKLGDIANIACGIAEDVSFNGSGNALITHGLGWTPTVMIFQALMSSGIVHVSHRDAGVMNSTSVDVRGTTNLGVYANDSIAVVFWIAVGSA